MNDDGGSEQYNRDFVLDKIGELRGLLDSVEGAFETGVDPFDVRDAAQTFHHISMTSGVMASALAETLDVRTIPQETDEGKDES